MELANSSSCKLIKYINFLPDDMVREIYEFIPWTTRLFLSKELYDKKHRLVKPVLLERGVFDNYVRHMVRNDNDFIFYYIADENWKHWLKYKKYTYKNLQFTNYIYFLEKLCVDHDSTKCRNIIHFFLEKFGLGKNQHKNNVFKLLKREWHR